VDTSDTAAGSPGTWQQCRGERDDLPFITVSVELLPVLVITEGR
jgi:hypothetical protein